MGIFMCRCGGGEETSDYDNINNYEGEKKLGQRHGRGVYYYGDGSVYDGQWQWGKKHGYGTYSFANGTKKIGFFYNDEYIGDTPGNLFSEERESDPAKPLLEDKYQTLRTPVGEGIGGRNTVCRESREEIERRKREKEEREKKLERRQREREVRTRRREEMRKKYDLKS